MTESLGGAPVHKITSRIDGIDCDTYFFETWVSHEHPVQMIAPVEFHETHRLHVYYEGSLLDDEEAPKLIRVLKWSVSIMPVPPKDVPARLNPGHNYFEMKQAQNAEPVPGLPIGAEEAALAEAFFHVEAGNDGELILAERIEKAFVYSYTYTYSDAGALTKAVIKNTVGSKVLELEPDEE